MSLRTLRAILERLKKYCSHAERGFLGLGERCRSSALAKAQVPTNPVTEPKRSPNTKRPLSHPSQPRGYSISENALKGCLLGCLKGCLLGCLIGIALAVKAQPEIDGHPDSYAFYLIPPDTDDWTRHFHIGAMVGLNISGNFKLNGTFGVSGNNPAQGIFDDGYVRHDKTGDAGGLTSFWGYNNQSQVNGQNLTMHATSGYTAADNANADAGASPGFDLAYGANYWYWKHARVGWELGFDLLPISLKDSRQLSATSQSSSYVFNTGNPFLPTAPYQGGSSGSGILISDGSPTVTTQTNGNSTVSGTRSLDAIIYSVRLGPSFDWDLGSHVGMTLSAGPVLGVVSGEYSFNEVINSGGISSHNHGSFDSVGLQYGGYFNATFKYHINESADFYVGAQYMTMDDYNISAPGRSARLDLSGQVYLSAGISWPF
jgi:hypothetical protein